MGIGLKIIGGLFVAGAITSIVSGGTKTTAATPAGTTITSTVATPKEREPWLLAATGVYSKTHDALRDPDSFKLEYLGTREDKNVLVGCMEFRSKNGFGGVNKGFAVWVYSADPKILFAAIDGSQVTNKDLQKAISSTSFSIDKPERWNKHCANKQLIDRTKIMAAKT